VVGHIHQKSQQRLIFLQVNDTKEKILLTHAFLEDQSQKESSNIIYQDNKSVILLAEIGRRSVIKRTRQMDIRYFLVKDHLASGKITIDHCLTKNMIADILQNP